MRHKVCVSCSYVQDLRLQSFGLDSSEKDAGSAMYSVEERNHLKYSSKLPLQTLCSIRTKNRISNLHLMPQRTFKCWGNSSVANDLPNMYEATSSSKYTRCSTVR